MWAGRRTFENEDIDNNHISSSLSPLSFSLPLSSSSSSLISLPYIQLSTPLSFTFPIDAQVPLAPVAARALLLLAPSVASGRR